MTPYQAYYKATRDLGERTPELETLISQDAKYSFRYAKHVIKGRWELGENSISKDAKCSYWYAIDVIKGRWELGENSISKDAKCSYWYAIDVIKGRLPDFMHNQIILGNNEYTKEYVEFIQ